MNKRRPTKEITNENKRITDAQGCLQNYQR